MSGVTSLLTDRHRGTCSLWVAVLVAFAGCALAPPPVAEPSAAVAPEILPGTADTITYGELTPRDFKAEWPPQELEAHGRLVGAVLCGKIVLGPDARIVAHAVHPTDANSPYVALMENLSFRAEMDRNCSWLNRRELAASSYPYILQHEQVHFAILELAARRLNGQAQRWMKEWTHTAASSDETVAEGRLYLERAMEALTADIARRNADFDRDTSFTASRSKQLLWFHQIQSELARNLADGG